MSDLDTLTLEKDGAVHVPGAVAACLDALRTALADHPIDKPGVRLRDAGRATGFLTADGEIGSVAARALGGEARPVRAVLFDKTAGANWSLNWHQDRTICVRRRIAVEGFGPWTTKGGMQHVAPPFEVLARMVTLRVHLDDVPADNAPLLIAPGSHAQGPISVGDIDTVVSRCGVRTCLAEAGDIWMYATPILHASEAVARPARRRVLQIDYANRPLPGGLEWLGV